jgi:hypothetical protein
LWEFASSLAHTIHYPKLFIYCLVLLFFLHHYPPQLLPAQYQQAVFYYIDKCSFFILFLFYIYLYLVLQQLCHVYIFLQGFQKAKFKPLGFDERPFGHVQVVGGGPDHPSPYLLDIWTPLFVDHQCLPATSLPWTEPRYGNESVCHGGQVGVTQDVYDQLKDVVPDVEWKDLGAQPGGPSLASRYTQAIKFGVQ